jgi:hypothetical protein
MQLKTVGIQPPPFLIRVLENVYHGNLLDPKDGAAIESLHSERSIKNRWRPSHQERIVRHSKHYVGLVNAGYSSVQHC